MEGQFRKLSVAEKTKRKEPRKLSRLDGFQNTTKRNPSSSGSSHLDPESPGEGRTSNSGYSTPESVNQATVNRDQDHNSDTEPRQVRPRFTRPLSCDLSQTDSGSDAESDTVDFHADDDDEEYKLDYTPSKKEVRVINICQEILSSEQRYVSRLEDLVTIRDITSKMLGQDVTKQMFLNIDVIYALHQNFLPKLQQRIFNWNEKSRLGDLMQTMMSFMKLYTDYVKGVQNGIELVHSWMKKNRAFNKLIKDYTHSKRKQLKIDARMIDPVQRVPRYELLLREYLKYLPEDSEDIKDIKEALDKVSEANRYFEDMIERDRKVSELLKLQQSLDSPVNIFNYSREVISDSAALILNQKTNKFNPCHVYLLTDLLLVTRNVHSMTSVRKRVKHLMHLGKCKVGPGSSNCRCLTVFTRMAEIEIEFETKEKRIEWEQLLRHRLADLTKRKLIRRGTWEAPKRNQTLFNKPPQLVLPHTSQVCMLCGLDFVTPKRKKNCEACGMLVCSNCSSHRLKLPYDEKTEHRVCHDCYAAYCKMYN